MEAKFKRLKRDFDSQRKKLTETRRELGEIKRENQQKSRECQEAWNSLKELQNELMCKSMHVGSLVNEQLESHEDLKSKYIEGATERKDLYNKVLELRGKLCS
ncbi:hypothetical protein JHK87_047587 [Glycine soja]|nr:hypothetical protein JHK87_047587 [Glycine soja]